MSIGLEFSKLNSERFVRVNEPIPAGEYTLPMDKRLFAESLLDFQTNNNFDSPFEEVYFSKKERINDDICLQYSFIEASASSITLQVLECDGTYTTVSSSFRQDCILTGNVGGTPEVQLATSTYTFKMSDITSTRLGKMYLILTFTGIDALVELWVSEPLYVAESWPDTQKHSWSCTTNKFDTVFTLVPTRFNKRFDSWRKFKTNKISRTMFTNQRAAQRGLYAVSWRLYDFNFGNRTDEFGCKGLSEKDIDLICDVQKCDVYIIDSQRYIMDEGADPEPIAGESEYPLYQLTLQLAEYYPADSIPFYRGSKIFLFDSGELPPAGLSGYPYALNMLVMVNQATGSVFNLLYDNTNGIKEVHDSTMQTAFLAELNAKTALAPETMTGSFFKDTDDKIYYRNVDTEAWDISGGGAGINIMRTCMLTAFSAAVGNKTLDLRVYQPAGANTILSIWDVASGTPELVADNYTTYPILFISVSATTIGAKTLYIYSDNRMTDLWVENDLSYRIIRGFTGSVSSKLNLFRSKGGIMSTFSFTFLKYGAKTLAVVNLQYLGFTTMTMSDLIVAPGSGDWQYFNFLYLLNNKLTAAGQDAVFNDYQTYILYTYFATTPVGIIDTRFQVPASAPTGASALARTNEAASGYTINF